MHPTLFRKQSVSAEQQALYRHAIQWGLRPTVVNQSVQISGMTYRICGAVHKRILLETVNQQQFLGTLASVRANLMKQRPDLVLDDETAAELWFETQTS